MIPEQIVIIQFKLQIFKFSCRSLICVSKYVICALEVSICLCLHNTVVSNHFHSVKILLFSSARSRDSDGLIGIELPVLMYTTKTPIDVCRFNVRSST